MGAQKQVNTNNSELPETLRSQLISIEPLRKLIETGLQVGRLAISKPKV